MATRTVALDLRDETLKRIERAGTERLLAVDDNGDGTVTIRTDRLTEAKKETR